MPCYSPLKGFKCEETGGIVFKNNGKRETMEVACGQCIGCRLDRSRMWAMRMVHESSLHETGNGSLFVTLTYREKYHCTKAQLDNGYHIPEDWSLSVPKRDENGKHMSSHVQLFLKRLRKVRKGDAIKYYYCGEYGSRCMHGLDLSIQKCPLCNVGRPHYHICLFNVQFPDLEPYAEEMGITRYTSKELESLWKMGFVDVGNLTMQSAGYVARYVLKKVTGKKAEDWYQRIEPDGTITEIAPEFAHMSNGLGKDYYEKYKGDFFPSDEVPVPGEGVIKKVPRYYQEMYEKEDPVGHELMKERRLEYRRENENEYTPERLWSKYKVKQSQVDTLKRGLTT